MSAQSSVTPATPDPIQAGAILGAARQEYIDWRVGREREAANGSWTQREYDGTYWLTEYGERLEDEAWQAAADEWDATEREVTRLVREAVAKRIDDTLDYVLSNIGRDFAADLVEDVWGAVSEAEGV